MQIFSLKIEMQNFNKTFKPFLHRKFFANFRAIFNRGTKTRNKFFKNSTQTFICSFTQKKSNILGNVPVDYDRHPECKRTPENEYIN